METLNKDFPKYLSDFVSLSRPISELELQLADKEFLISLVCQLKEKELKYYKLYHELNENN